MAEQVLSAPDRQPVEGHEAQPAERRPARRSLLHPHPVWVVIAGVCAVLVRQAVRSGLAGDVFYTVASGRWMLAHHAIARHDVFSYTVTGRPWTDEEWGFQWLLAWSVAHVGPVSYWLVSAGACCAALLVGVALWRVTGAGWLWAGALSVLAGAGMYLFVTPRPEDLSYLFFAALLADIALARRRAVWLAALPALFVVWANLHGSFLMGLGILVIELAWALLPTSVLARAQGRLSAAAPLPRLPVALALCASFAATLVNPNGPGLLSYAYHVSSAPELTSFIQEWQSPDFHSVFLLAVIVGPVLLLAALLAFSNARFALDHVAIAGALFLATLHAGRFMPYLALAMCAVLSTWAPIKTETIKGTVLSLPAAAIACAALVAAGHYVAPGTPQGAGSSTGNPVAAVHFLSHRSGRIFSTYWWDNYLVYRNIPVFVDGRTDLYFGTGILQSYIDVSDLSVNPDPVFRHWDVRWVIWEKETALSVYLADDRGWHEVFHAGDAIVFEHLGRWN